MTREGTLGRVRLFEGNFVGTLESLNLYVLKRGLWRPPEGAVLSAAPPPRGLWRVISPSATSLMDAALLKCPSFILHLQLDELNPF